MALIFKGFLRKKFPLYLFLLPSVIVIVLVLIYPTVKAILMSFQYWNLLNPSVGHKFVAFKNYKDILSSSLVNSFWLAVLYTFWVVFFRMIIGFGTALMLNRPFRGKSIARGIMIIPWAMPVVASCLLWMLMYDSVYGVINNILKSIPFIPTPLNFLGDTSLALFSTIIVGIWKGFPFVTVMLLAGLQSIPQELYEASSVDGATGWQRLVKITIPVLKPVWVVVLLLQVIWTIREFEMIYLLTRGGPSQATSVLTVDVYLNAFQYFQFGRAAAEGTVLLVFSLVFTAIYLAVLKGEESVW